MSRRALTRPRAAGAMVAFLVVALGLLGAQPVNAAPNRNPVAILTVSPASGVAPLMVTADGSTSTDDQRITAYTFTWGDGSARTGPGTAARASHTYRSTGTFTVTLTVKDAKNKTSSTSKTVTVTSSTPADGRPTAALSVSPP